MRVISKQKKLVTLVLVFMLFSIALAGIVKPLNAFAYNEEDYESAGINFLQLQYESKELAYDNLEVQDAINLYDEKDVVISKLLILNRDGEWDYVVLDFMMDRINGYGINEYEYLQSFYGKGNIYYAGQMTFAYIQDGKYYDINGKLLEKRAFISAIQEFKLLAPQAASGSEGILSWNSVSVRHSSISNTAWYYLSGFNWNGVTTNSSGVKATYYPQYIYEQTYNSRYPGVGMSGACGPTAMTNMAIYFNSLGYNALINGSAQDTFDWFVSDLNWFSWGNQWWTNTKYSFQNYANNRGYRFSMTSYDSATFINFKGNLAEGRIIYTYVNTTQDNGFYWTHALVTVGYEQFTHYYQVNQPWWFFGWHDNWVNMETNYYYLRCIDGWSTSNSGQFIDFNGFYTKVMAAAFKFS